MSDKPSDKKDAGAADPKRPHATLDLKATEVKAAAEAKAAAEKGAPAAEAGAQKPDPNTSKAGDAVKPSAAPGQPPRSPSAFTRIMTHLAAGVAGGAVVLFGGDRIAELSGTPSPSARFAAATAELEKRVIPYLKLAVV